MPHIYGVHKVWCTHCGESRDDTNVRCPECNKMLRRSTRQKNYKNEAKRVK